MIVALRGKLVKSSPLSAVLDVGGVYYGVNIPITTAEKLPKLGSETFLHTFAVYREDSQTLYGFATETDRDFFAVLVEKVSGIGPKIALNMLECRRLLLKAQSPRATYLCFQSARASGKRPPNASCSNCAKPSAPPLEAPRPCPTTRHRRQMSRTRSRRS